MTDKPVTAFVGDSITAAGAWDEWFPELSTRNFGVDGDTTDGLIERLDEVIASDPQTIVLLIGTNDLAERRSIERIVRNIETALVRLHSELPDARILLVSVLPRGHEFAENVREINRHIWQFAATQRVHYLDLWPALARGDGELSPEYTDDRLHLTAAGYDAWLSELRPALERVNDLPPMSRPIRLPDLSAQ
ncbi:GDSL-type esterase/lipase family protein [Agreia sp. COWG]|uniref:GDSL-type esterase/lipase family protein n=1 Tax=Agreia sp. COWG TaxID=2773266 RepID=UPI001F245298|nr:GDSL-type esterase/lipase family protein [Agreia sp. COWG]